jgi:Ca-activated chloride channel family protein
VSGEKDPEYVNRVILLTDGQPTTGSSIRGSGETARNIENPTTTIGYGDDLNEDLLTALADAGRGNAYHVETADQAPTIFARS